MREMKDSGVPWIGEIPTGWSIRQANQVFAATKHLNVGLKENNLLSLSYGRIVRKSIETSFGLLPESFEGYNIIDKNTIVLRLTDLQNDQKSLRVGIAREKGIITSAYLSLRCITNDVPRYVYYLLHCFDIVKGFYGMGGGIRQGLTWDGVKNLRFFIPPPAEQLRIADFLDINCAEIDSILEKTRTSIEEYKRLKQSVITEAVTKGIRGKRALKDSGVEWIGEIPVEWNVLPLKQMFSFGKGLSITKDNLVESGYPVISYGQIHSKSNSGTSVDNSLIRFVKQEYIDNASLVDKNDFVFADTSEDLDGCGNCVFNDSETPFYGGYHTIVLHSKQDASHKYLAYLFKTDSWRFQIRSLLTEVKLYSVSQKVLKKTTVMVPQASEQQEIVAYLDEKCAAIDKLIASKEALITELEAYKKSLIYEYVTGKKEVI